MKAFRNTIVAIILIMLLVVTVTFVSIGTKSQLSDASVNNFFSNKTGINRNMAVKIDTDQSDSDMTIDSISKTEADISSIYEENCKALFSQDNMALSEKYSRLLIISYCQIANSYANGEISEEWYNLQIVPIVEARNGLLTASDREILDNYTSIITYLFETLSDEEAEGFEIDEDLLEFVTNEFDLYL